MGKAYFIEVNWRNDGTSHLFYQAGANLPLLWVLSVSTNNIAGISTKVFSKSYFIDEIFDEDNLRKKAITYEQWSKEREEASVFKYYDRDDLVPYEAAKKGKRKKLLLDAVIARKRIYIVWLLDKLGLKRK